MPLQNLSSCRGFWQSWLFVRSVANLHAFCIQHGHGGPFSASHFFHDYDQDPFGTADSVADEIVVIMIDMHDRLVRDENMPDHLWVQDLLSKKLLFHPCNLWRNAGSFLCT